MWWPRVRSRQLEDPAGARWVLRARAGCLHRVHRGCQRDEPREGGLFGGPPRGELRSPSGRLHRRGLRRGAPLRGRARAASARRPGSADARRYERHAPARRAAGCRRAPGRSPPASPRGADAPSGGWRVRSPGAGPARPPRPVTRCRRGTPRRRRRAAPRRPCLRAKAAQLPGTSVGVARLHVELEIMQPQVLALPDEHVPDAAGDVQLAARPRLPDLRCAEGPHARGERGQAPTEGLRGGGHPAPVPVRHAQARHPDLADLLIAPHRARGGVDDDAPARSARGRSSPASSPRRGAR